MERARAAGLGITIHCGEEGADGLEELEEVVETLRPDRIGHGIQAAGRPQAMRRLADAGIVLELCPSSNLLTRALADRGELARTVRSFSGAGVAWTVATDGPQMMRTDLRSELALLLECGAATLPELEQANHRAHAASFIAPLDSPG